MDVRNSPGPISSQSWRRFLLREHVPWRRDVTYNKRSRKIERHIPRGIIWKVQRFRSAGSQLDRNEPSVRLT